MTFIQNMATSMKHVTLCSFVFRKGKYSPEEEEQLIIIIGMLSRTEIFELGGDEGLSDVADQNGEGGHHSKELEQQLDRIRHQASSKIQSYSASLSKTHFLSILAASLSSSLNLFLTFVVRARLSCLSLFNLSLGSFISYVLVKFGRKMSSSK